MLADCAKLFNWLFSAVGLLSHPVSDEVLAWSRSVAMQASLKATLAAAQAFATTDFRPELRAFTVPTLVVHGTADKTAPIDATARVVVQHVPAATVIKYDGAAGTCWQHTKVERISWGRATSVLCPMK